MGHGEALKGIWGHWEDTGAQRRTLDHHEDTWMENIGMLGHGETLGHRRGAGMWGDAETWGQWGDIGVGDNGMWGDTGEGDSGARSKSEMLGEEWRCGEILGCEEVLGGRY